ncbi:nuclear transport factor 2 family protein [Mycobacterium sp. 21AC1]|uniref:nuclear transport factor 2 family protein n=1 Tax=[Mycobacterium] appelbergii TaxID=2939269 RepID=UPI002938D2DA|nr:nuclear transport factor 2 family protein [Mycobacterium sp. 21AC1]MDV3127024.1 nuclear transport factor 2 family protein [Mycobacterium sp. 21AC1]
MNDNAIAVLQRFYEAETAYLESEPKDFSVIAVTLHPDCVMHQPDALPYAGQWRGHQGFEQWMAAFSEVWSSLTVTAPQFFPSGSDVVFVRSTVEATARANGAKLTWPLLQMITVKDGLILEIQPFHWDTAAIAAALRPRT